jgi:hypothetical protein
MALSQPWPRFRVALAPILIEVSEAYDLMSPIATGQRHQRPSPCPFDAPRATVNGARCSGAVYRVCREGVVSTTLEHTR